MEGTDERRRLTRLPFAVEVRLRAGELALEATTRNVAMRGLMVTGTPLLPLGTACQVEIVLSSGLEEARITGQGEVVRHLQDPDTGQPGMGIRLVELDDASQERLWRVIRFNSPGAAAGYQSGDGV